MKTNSSDINKSNLAHPSIEGHARSIPVLHVIDTLQIGGAENQLVTLVPALNKNHYVIHVCCLGNEGIQANALRTNGFKVDSIHMRLRYWPIGLIKFLKLISRMNPQIVHTHLFHAGVWGRVAAILAHVPVIVTTEHGMTLWKKKRHLLIESILNRFTDKLIAVSEDIRQRRINTQGVSPDKIVMIPNAVDVTRFCQSDSRQQKREELGLDHSSIVIGTVARLVPPKRLDHLLEAARLVCNQTPRVKFLIIGDGPLRAELQTQASQLELIPDYVRFLGSRQDIPELLSAMDMFVLSSEREGLPVSLLEAMAASKPIVATLVGGIPQVIRDGYNGLLIPPHEPTLLAKAILALIEDATLCNSISQHAYRTVEAQYSINVVGQQIIDLYDDLLKKKASDRVH